jgi:MoaA/NifB/PqqE/SkfB family radical SAM enzyme
MSIAPEVSEIVGASFEADSSQVVTALPVLVLFPHNRCNCRCLMCDIWKIRQTREITARDLAPHLASLRALKVRWVVFSGGEPLLHSDLVGLSRLLRNEGIRVTLLTAGLLLERFAPTVAASVDDLIVSLDGPQQIHDEIRGIPGAFQRLANGVAAVRRVRPAMAICARCTVQKKNFRHLRTTVDTARQSGLNSVSFLAADVASEAFNRPQGWSSERQAGIALDARDVECLAGEVEALLQEYGDEIRSGFVVESEAKLRRIVLHFRAHLGQVAPVAPRCNAPWVSAVVEADGTVRPCFFHRPLGNLQHGLLHEIVNGPQALAFRRALDVSADPVCQKCVCPLYVPRPADA